MFDVAKLLDFGLVKSSLGDTTTVSVTIDGAFLGSPLYAPPEHAVGDHLDPRSDIYSLGATAYYLLSGTPVFSGDNPLRIVMAHASKSPQPLRERCPGVPADLEAVVMKCLEKKPENRYASIDALEQALGRTEAAAEWSPQQARAWWEASRQSAGDRERESARLTRANQETTKIAGLDSDPPAPRRGSAPAEQL